MIDSKHRDFQFFQVKDEFFVVFLSAFAIFEYFRNLFCGLDNSFHDFDEFFLFEQFNAFHEFFYELCHVNFAVLNAGGEAGGRAVAKTNHDAFNNVEDVLGGFLFIVQFKQS